MDSFKKEFTISWDEIYQRISSLNYLNFSEKEFKNLKCSEIKVNDLALHNYTNWIEVDIFWDKDKNVLSHIYDRESMFFKETGRKRGAEAVWRYKNDNEKMTLVLFRMYIWQIKEKFPYEWGEEIRRLCAYLMQVLFKRADEMDMHFWDTRVKNIMPFSLVHGSGIERFLIPTNIDDIIDIFVVNINYILNTYILVKCIDPKRGDKLRKLVNTDTGLVIPPFE